MKLRELADSLSCELDGDGEIDITGVSTLEAAVEGQLSFLTNPKYRADAEVTKASALIVPRDAPSMGRALLRCSNAYLTFARALEIFNPRVRAKPGTHSTAWIDRTAPIAPHLSLGAFSFVGANVVIESGTEVRVRCVIESGARIGRNCILHSGSVIREGVQIGADCIIQNNAVIGSDGFGYARTDEGAWYRIPQTGVVVLEAGVDAGARGAMDRATLGETRVATGTRIDNQVHIGHGCQVGPDNLLCAQVGLAGSTRTGARVILAGQVGAAGHLEIGEGVIATAQTGIPSSIEPGRHVSGSPAVDHKVWLKVSAAYSRIPDLIRSVRELERRVQHLATLVDRNGKQV